jgi:hypothetical protein
MNALGVTLNATLRELVGLFVEDGSLALAIMGVVAIAAILSFLLAAPGATGVVLLAGCWGCWWRIFCGRGATLRGRLPNKSSLSADTAIPDRRSAAPRWSRRPIGPKWRR